MMRGEGLDAILQCNRTVEGCPAPSINWKYKEHELSSSSNYTIITTSNSTQLIINNASVSDSGIYECEVIDGHTGTPYTEQINLTVSSKVNSELITNVQKYYRCHHTNN